MSFYTRFSEKIIVPLSDLVLGRHLGEYLSLLERSQYWSESEMHAFQDERLRLLIRHAYDNVPYYNDLFRKLKLHPDDVRTRGDLWKIPVITKKDLKENGKRMWALNAKHFFQNSSSGSTGEPLKYLSDRPGDSFGIACNLRGWSWMGFRLGHKYVKISVNPRKGFMKKMQDKANRCCYLHSRGVSDSDSEAMAAAITGFRPLFLRGYPSTLSVVAEYVLKNNIKFDSILAINSTGEILFPHLREKMETAFSAPVFDSYSGEAGATFFECKDHTHYHISEEYAITELLSDNEIIQEGTGEIITTNLWNWAMPFIRYNVKDIALIGKTECNQGIRLRTAEKIIGRDVDILTTLSGKKLIVHFFTGYFEWIDEVDRFQCIQVSPGEILLKLVVNERFSENIKRKIADEVGDYIGRDMRLYVSIVDDIPVNPLNGKRRFLYKDF